jgi:hypothetical protein
MTNKVALRTVEEFMQDYTPVYQPLYPLLLGKSQSYSEEVGSVNFKRVDTVGDIRAKHITPKDTEMKQIAAKESSKTFKKYFLGNQYIQSALQDQKGVEDVNAQVLDEHQKQFDELVLLGEGTSASTMVNNGLFWSNDPNYILESSAEVALGTDHKIDMYAKVMTTLAKADQISGRKAIVFYGTTALPKFDGLFVSNNASFKAALQAGAGPGVSLLKLPAGITPSGENGWMIINLDQVKLHYTALPTLKDQGVNDEKMYTWSNFLMGSAMVEVLAYGGIIRQPVTFGA